VNFYYILICIKTIGLINYIKRPNILKISVSARRSVIRLSVCYTFVLKFYFITQQFLMVRVKDLILSLGAGYPRYTTDTHTTGFWKVCNYIELSKPSFILSAFYQKKMKEPQKILFSKTSELSGFFLTLHAHAERQRGNLWIPIGARVYPV